MKKKPEVNKHKGIKTLETKTNYSGERSPYWDFLSSRGRSNDKGEVLEHALGNPDVLSDEAKLIKPTLSEQDELRMDVIREVFPGLSSREKEVLQLCGFEGRSEEEAAKQLQIKRLTVRTLLDRVRAQIQRRYEYRLIANLW